MTFAKLYSSPAGAVCTSLKWYEIFIVTSDTISVHPYFNMILSIHDVFLFLRSCSVFISNQNVFAQLLCAVNFKLFYYQALKDIKIPREQLPCRIITTLVPSYIVMSLKLFMSSVTLWSFCRDIHKIRIRLHALKVNSVSLNILPDLMTCGGSTRTHLSLYWKFRTT